MSLMRRREDPYNLVPKSFWHDDIFDSMLNRMDNLERSLMKDMPSTSKSIMHPKIDLKETEKSYEITAEFPGLEKKDIHVDLDEENRVLTFSGEHKDSVEKKEEKYHYRERSYGSFKRSVRLPDDVKMESIKAHMNHGLLQIDLPKEQKSVQPPQKKRSIEIGEKTK